MSFQTISFVVKNTFRKKLVTALSITGIAIGVGLMVTLSSASAGFNQLLDNTIAETLGDVRVTEYNKDITISQLPENITDTIMTIENSEKIEAISPIIYVQGFEQFSENITASSPHRPGMATVALNARGINPINDAQFEGPTTRIIEGRVYQTNFEIIVADFLTSDSNGFFVVGQTIDFQINFTYAIPLTVVGIFDTSQDTLAMLHPTIVMSVATGRMLNNLFLPYELTGYNYVNIRFDSSSLETTEKYAEELEALEPKLQIELIGEAMQDASSVMQNFNTVQIILTVIVIVAGGMAIIVAQLMGVTERMKEFAIMKATGWKNRTILFTIILESIIIGLVGALIGFGFGAGLIFIAQRGATETFIVITWQIALQVLALGIGFGLIAGLIPGIRAARVKPMEVIRGL